MLSGMTQPHGSAGGPTAATCTVKITSLATVVVVRMNQAWWRGCGTCCAGIRIGPRTPLVCWGSGRSGCGGSATSCGPNAKSSSMPVPARFRPTGSRSNAEHGLLDALPRLAAALVYADPQVQAGAGHHAALASHR